MNLSFRSRENLSIAWLNLAVIALAYSGILTILIAGSRIPGIAETIQDSQFARRALVVHVDLGVLSWFAAIPLVLSQLFLGSFGAGASKKVLPLGSLGVIFAGAGILLMAAGAFLKDAEIFLANYIPLLGHPSYFAGLIIFGLGVAASLAEIASALRNQSSPISSLLNLPQSLIQNLRSMGLGIRVGVVYLTMSLLALVSSWLLMPQGLPDLTRYEVQMWGGGHLLQISNVVFLIITWSLLLTWAAGRPSLSPKSLNLVFLWLALPLLPAIFFMSQDPSTYLHRTGFTRLMQWGIFPPVLFYLFCVVKGRRRNQAGASDPMKAQLPGALPKAAKALQLSVAASALMILVGFVFGAFIQGQDLRIPGHYHASIGAVTLGFMVLARVLLSRWRSESEENLARSLKWLTGLYFSGQLTHATGLFIAGCYGISRKTYGADQQVIEQGGKIGLMIMGIGGGFALLGGAYFSIVALRLIFARRS